LVQRLEEENLGYQIIDLRQNFPRASTS